MDYAEIELQTLVLMAEISGGSSTYTDAQLSTGIQWAQEQLAYLMGLTYTEAKLGMTGFTGATGATQNSVLYPEDMMKMVRVQLWDASMTDLIGA
jgi:hypothetical protein